ncbi:MAG: AbrB/MazE/SpoVT family DNA-binding domain-containing protein [Armatimonadota bacterium]
MDPETLKLENFFYGSATLGERGQIVIPAEARKDCDIHSGDKLLVFRHPLHPRMLILATIGEMQQLLQQMARSLEQMEARVAESVSEEE